MPGYNSNNGISYYLLYFNIKILVIIIIKIALIIILTIIIKASNS